jgi:squalene-associated FAD-dependent desaturase
MNPPPRMLVVGGGWSGLAAALRLTDSGARVTLLEAARQLGGRARRVDFVLGDARYALDNGPHLLAGAYSSTLALMRRCGVDAGSELVRLPFELRYADGFGLRAARLPAPWHLAGALLTARGMGLTDRIATARWALAWRSRGWHTASDRNALSLFEGMPPRLVARIWEPLCLAALNVRLAEASARIFLNVLRDTIGAAAAAADFLVPRHDLGRLLPDAAARVLQQAGAEVRCGARVTALRQRGSTWHATLLDSEVAADAVVLALPAPRAADLIESTPAASFVPLLNAVRHAPIATVYLRYSSRERLQSIVQPLVGDPARQRFGQWVFDRGALDSTHAGILSIVISGAGPHLELEQPALADAIARQLTDTLGLPAPSAHAVIVEKRATIAPVPNLQRPPARLLRGLYLAGDAADSPYPSTLEGSIRAGDAAAAACLVDCPGSSTTS